MFWILWGLGMVLIFTGEPGLGILLIVMGLMFGNK